MRPIARRVGARPPVAALLRPHLVLRVGRILARHLPEHTLQVLVLGGARRIEVLVGGDVEDHPAHAVEVELRPRVGVPGADEERRAAAPVGLGGRVADPDARGDLRRAVEEDRRVREVHAVADAVAEEEVDRGILGLGVGLAGRVGEPLVEPELDGHRPAEGVVSARRRDLAAAARPQPPVTR